VDIEAMRRRAESAVEQSRVLMRRTDVAVAQSRYLCRSSEQVVSAQRAGTLGEDCVVDTLDATDAEREMRRRRAVGGADGSAPWSD
jgi:hypothetical protein